MDCAATILIDVESRGLFARRGPGTKWPLAASRSFIFLILARRFLRVFFWPGFFSFLTKRPLDGASAARFVSGVEISASLRISTRALARSDSVNH